MTAFARYCVVGLLGHAVDLGVYSNGLVALVLHHVLSTALAVVVAASTNFGPDRRWTFAARHYRVRVLAWRFPRRQRRSLQRRAAILAAAVDVLHVPPLPAQAASIAVATPLSLLGNRLPTFGAPSFAAVRGRARDPVQTATRSDERRPT